MDDLALVVWRLVPPVLLVVASLLALRRWVRPDRRAPETLRVLARTGLTRSAVISVVAVGRRRFLLGAGEGGVRLLTELTPEPTTPEPAMIHEPVRVDLPGVIRGTDPASHGPRTGLLDRLRDRTVRLPVDRAGHDVHR